MKSIVIYRTLIFSLIFSAAAHAHAPLAAHEHGSVKLSIAIEGKNIALELEGPSESFLGFEHKAQIKADLLTLKKAKELWTVELLSKLVIFDNSLECKVGASSFEQVSQKGVHSEIEARAEITCMKDVAGSDLKNCSQS